MVMFTRMVKCFLQPILFIALLEFIFIMGLCDATAGFLGSYPLDPPDGMDSQEYPFSHDPDVKIPGRHFPKLPYRRKERHRNHQLYSPKFGTRNHEYMKDYKIDLDADQKDEDLGPIGPYFDRDLQRNISVQVGKTAALTCRILNIGEYSVSWIRLNDLHILTVGKYKYSMDARHSVEVDTANNEWILKIADVTYRDAGKYECQISAEPMLSFIVNMEVHASSSESSRSKAGHVANPLPMDSPPNKFSAGETGKHFSKLNDEKVPIYSSSSQAKAFILDGPDIHVHDGSMKNLTCVLNHGKYQKVTFKWRHHDEPVDLTARNKAEFISVINFNQTTISNLLITNITGKDTGKYTCTPNTGDSDTVTLHVHKGDIRAAMQANGTRSKYETNLIYIYIVVLYTINIVNYLRNSIYYAIYTY